MSKPAAILLLLSLMYSGCKKDLLSFQNVQKVALNTSSRFNRIHFFNNNICIIAGGTQWTQSNVLTSNDGGFSWADSSYASVPIGLYGMGVSPTGAIYLCTQYGNVLHSTDTGKTWQYNRIYTFLDYVGGTFPSKDTGIFVSTILQRQCTITRVDPNFNVIDNQTFLFGLNNIYMVSSTVGYIIGYGTVMKTTDRGNTWSFQNVEGDNFESMDIHGNEIWMCGFNGGVYHTTDGGNNWQRLRNGNDITLPRYNLNDIAFKDDGINGWAVCDNGKMIHTDDAGNHWEEYNQFTTSSLRCVAVCPNGDLLTGGDNGNLFRLTLP